MKTLILAAIRCSLIFTAVAALSIAYPTSVQAVPTTYYYTGGRFTFATGEYTTSDFVTVVLTFADPLGPNFGGNITPIAFTFSDGLQTITNLTSSYWSMSVATGPSGQITAWALGASIGPGFGVPHIETVGFRGATGRFLYQEFALHPPGSFGARPRDGRAAPGVWSFTGFTELADTGSTLSLMTLTLMALGVAARQFKRAAA